MKAIIQSYTPQECERIINGQQTLKVCKTAPKDTPFKVYMYCTKRGDMFFHGGIGEKQVLYYNPDEKRYKFDYPLELICCKNKYTKDNFLSGKVIGEYVCDWVGEITPHCDIQPNVNQYEHHYPAILGWNDCMSFEEMKSYLGNSSGVDMHISNVKIYDKPKELGEFVTVKCTNKRGSCSDCKIKPDCIKQITRPPHGWQYVEDLRGA